MFILRDLLYPLQTQFSDSKLGREHGHWFVFTLLAVIVLYLIDDVQSVVLPTNPLRSESGTATLLYLHAIVKDSVPTLMARNLAPDS